MRPTVIRTSALDIRLARQFSFRARGCFVEQVSHLHVNAFFTSGAAAPSMSCKKVLMRCATSRWARACLASQSAAIRPAMILADTSAAAAAPRDQSGERKLRAPIN